MIIDACQPRVTFDHRHRSETILFANAIAKPNRVSGHLLDPGGDNESLIEASRSAKAETQIDDGKMDAAPHPVRIRYVPPPHVLDASLFEVGQVRRVVNHTHQIGVDKTHADDMAGTIVGRILAQNASQPISTASQHQVDLTSELGSGRMPNGT